MSDTLKRNFPFTILEDIVLEDLSLTKHAKLVYWTLCKHADKHGEACFPGLTRISELSGSGKATVIAAIQELISAGYIHKEKIRHSTKDGDITKKFDSNQYTILLRKEGSIQNLQGSNENPEGSIQNLQRFQPEPLKVLKRYYNYIHPNQIQLTRESSSPSSAAPGPSEGPPPAPGSKPECDSLGVIFREGEPIVSRKEAARRLKVIRKNLNQKAG